ncbi:MAG TPA: polymer-forming cytoskeletal protein [Dehalococcoidia bacterium]|nr:polymer-forming cytoskeletal protein [Dehalococcoidia bacterium]
MRTEIEKRFRRYIGREKGQTLVLVLCFLALGGLTIANSLNFVTTSIDNVKIHQSQMVELYSADAGLEKAIWSLTRNEIPIVPGEEVDMAQFLMNSKAVDVNIFNTFESGNRTFRITSTASTGNRSGTTVKSYVECEIGFFYVGTWDMYETGRFEMAENETYTGNIWLTAGNGAVVGGNFTGNIYAEEGNIIVEDGGIVTGDIYLLKGNIRIYADSKILGKICLRDGNVQLLEPGAYVETDEIHVGNNVRITADTTVVGDIYSAAVQNIGGTHDGTWYPTNIADYECPMLDGLVTTYSYEIQ